MSRGKSIVSFAVWCTALLVLIFDSKTASSGALEGIELCLYTVVPVLFPFFIVSGMINHMLSNQKISFMKPLRKICKIPEGSEAVLLLGLTGGYPVGAKCISESKRFGSISSLTAKRMFAFCNNAGPSYIFGFMLPLFSTSKVSVVIWFIHIISAIITAIIFPVNTVHGAALPVYEEKRKYDNLTASIHSISKVCGWIVVFKVIIAFFEIWFLRYIPSSARVLVLGLIELTNGTILLNTVALEGQRFVYASVMLAAGGICVAMQVRSFAEKEHFKYYLIGKMLQTCVAFLMALVIQWLLFDSSECYRLAFMPIVSISVIVTISAYLNRKKLVEIWKTILYNRHQKPKEVLYAISKEN